MQRSFIMDMEVYLRQTKTFGKLRQYTMKSHIISILKLIFETRIPSYRQRYGFRLFNFQSLLLCIKRYTKNKTIFVFHYLYPYILKMMHLPKIIPCSLSMKIGGIFMSIFMQCELFDIKNVKLHKQRINNSKHNNEKRGVVAQKGRRSSVVTH